MSQRRGLDDLLELGLPAEVALRAAELIREGGSDAELLALLQGSPVLLLLLIRFASCSFYSSCDTPIDEGGAWRMLGGRRLRPYFAAVLQVMPAQAELPQAASWRERMQQAADAVLQVCSRGRNDAARTLLRLLELVPMLSERRTRSVPSWQEWGHSLLVLLQEHVSSTSPLVALAQCLDAPHACKVSEELRRQAAMVHLSLALAEQGLRTLPGSGASAIPACNPEVWSILDLSPWRLQNLLEEAHV